VITDPMDVVRELFRAITRADVRAIAALYASEALVEPVLDGQAPVVAAGQPLDVQSIAGMATGWGWVRADWVLRPSGSSGAPARRGYSHFWIEDGRIRRQRDAWDDGSRETPPLAPRDHPQKPSRPVVGVGAVIVADDRRVVLVRRRHEPLAGQWSLPGGRLELGESLEAGTAREVYEETGLLVEVGPVVDVFDRILLDASGGVAFHFVLIDYLCRMAGGALTAGSDVDDVALASVEDLAARRVTDKVRDVVARALTMR